MLFNFNFVRKYVQLKMQCGKSLSARRSLWSYTKFDKPWAWWAERSYQPHRGGGTDAAGPTTAGPMLAVGAWKASRCDRPKFRKFYSYFAAPPPVPYDVAMRAITVIRLNLNHPFKTPRSATVILRVYVLKYKRHNVIRICILSEICHGPI